MPDPLSFRIPPAIPSPAPSVTGHPRNALRPSGSRARARVASGRARRAGLTLIELLIVLVVIGALASVAMPRFWDTRRRAHVASIKWELRNAVPRAEAHYMENASYAGLVLEAKTPGVSLQMVESGPLGYRLLGRHQGAPGAECVLTGGALADGAPGSAPPDGVRNFGPACK